MLVTERRAESIQPGHLAARACGCYGVLFFQQQIDHMRLPRSIVPARLGQRNQGSDAMVSPHNGVNGRCTFGAGAFGVHRPDGSPREGNPTDAAAAVARRVTGTPPLGRQRGRSWRHSGCAANGGRPGDGAPGKTAPRAGHCTAPPSALARPGTGMADRRLSLPRPRMPRRINTSARAPAGKPGHGCLPRCTNWTSWPVPGCGSRMSVIALILDPAEIRKIISCLARQGRGPPTQG